VPVQAAGKEAALAAVERKASVGSGQVIVVLFSLSM